MTQAAAYSDPAYRLEAVTPSDSTDLTGARALYVGTAGNLLVRLPGAPTTTVTLANVQAGTFIPIRVTRVMAATTASDIVAVTA